MSRRDDVKSEMIQRLLSGSGEALPTSSFGRLGRTGVALLRAARVMRRTPKDDADVDLAELARIITSIGKLKGVAMKMGQIMSYIDMAIPPELQSALSVLQTHATPMPWDDISALIHDELGERAGALLDTMDQVPVSAASIGQVHRAALPDGTPVAVKVQYPEVAKAIANDFGPAAVGTKMASLFYPNARIDAFVKEARDRFLEECDYHHEAAAQARFARIYADHPVVFVPPVHTDYCTERVLTTSFVQGQSFDAFLASDPSQEVRDRVGQALFDFYLGSLFRHHIYNCDPHPGNTLFMADGRVAMLDYGCVRDFDVAFVARLAALTRAVHSDTQDALHQALLDLAIVRPGKPYDYEMIRGFLRSYYGPMLDDKHAAVDLSSAMEMREVMRKKQQLMKFALPGEFLFLFRIRFGLMSVLARLDARANWYQLERAHLADFDATVEADP